jgi:hypothetical protein
LVLGAVVLLFLALLFKLVMEGIGGGLAKLLGMLIATIISIPVFLYNLTLGLAKRARKKGAPAS